MQFTLVETGGSGDFHDFNGNVGDRVPISTSGNLDGGTITVLQRNASGDTWVSNPDVSLEANAHLVGVLELTAPLNRILQTGGGSSTAVNGVRGNV